MGVFLLFFQHSRSFAPFLPPFLRGPKMKITNGKYFINLGGPIIVCFINGRVLYYFGPPFIIAPLIFIRRLYFILF